MRIADTGAGNRLIAGGNSGCGGLVISPVEQSPVDDHAATDNSLNVRHSNTNACLIGPVQPASGNESVASARINRLTAEITDSHGDITKAKPDGFANDGESIRQTATGVLGDKCSHNDEWFAVATRMMR